MNAYAKVQSLITAWKFQSLSRTDLIRAIAEACLGWPHGPFCSGRPAGYYRIDPGEAGK